MGNIRMSQGAREEAAQWYAKAEAVAAAAEDARPASAEQQHGSSSASGAGAPPAGSFRWNGVEVGYTRTLQLPSGASWVMQTLSHHVENIDDWVPLLQDFDGLLQLAAHECVGELKPNGDPQCLELSTERELKSIVHARRGL